MRDTNEIIAGPDQGQSGRRSSRRSRASFVVLGLAAMLVVVGAVSANVASADPSADDWLRLRQCESGNNYTINTGNNYYGAYQFDAATWRSVGGTGLPHQASPATQDALALKLWQQRGWSPWVCATILGLGGSSSPPSPPRGVFDSIQVNGRIASIAGWAVDPNNSSTSIQVHVYVDNSGNAFVADKDRPDVNAALAISGRHGFSETIQLQPGSNKVCAFAIGQADNNNTLLDCKTVQGPAWPVGQVDAMTVSGWNVDVVGWTFDPNSSGTSTSVHLYINGAFAGGANADRSRDDVNAAYGIGGRHGFSVSGRLKSGPNSVCAYSIGLASFNNIQLPCRTVNGPVPPVGNVDVMNVSGLQAKVVGWAFDPNNSAAAIPVHMYVNGVGAAYSADKSRGDVNGVFRIGGQHGFDETVQLRSGSNSICVFAIGQADNNNTLLSCRDIQSGSAAMQRMAVPGAPPEVAAAAGVESAESDVPATSDNESSSAATSSAVSSADATPSEASTSVTAPTTAASTTAASVIPVPGSTTASTTSTESVVVSVPPLPSAFTSSPPSTVATTPIAPPTAKGALESLVATGQSWALTGWIADPAAGPTGTRVRITVNGVTHDVLADKVRDDVTRADGSPAAVGFADSVNLAPGANEICLYEVDGENAIVTAPVACRTETIP